MELSYYQRNKQRLQEYQREYYKNNYTSIRQYQNNYWKNYDRRNKQYVKPQLKIIKNNNNIISTSEIIVSFNNFSFEN